MALKKVCNIMRRGKKNKIDKKDRITTSEVFQRFKDNRGEMEIERKFLMSGFPDNRLFLAGGCLTHQAYLSIHPEIRIRSSISERGDSKYEKTLKRNAGTTLKVLIREETNIDITEREFDTLLRGINRKPIQKECKDYILEDGSIMKVCRVDESFYYGEVEFSSMEQANNWSPVGIIEEYIIEEVTDDGKYKMANYWKETRGLGVGGKR